MGWTSSSASTTSSAFQRAGGVTTSWTVPTGQTKSPVWARSPGPSPRRVAVQLDSTAVSTTAACPPSCAAMASPTVLRGRTSTAAVSLHLPQSNFSNISKIMSQAPHPHPFCLHQLCSNANWENWCVKLRPVVFRSTSVATALLTACLFTLMSPAAMVTFPYVSSLSRFSPSHCG